MNCLNIINLDSIIQIVRLLPREVEAQVNPLAGGGDGADEAAVVIVVVEGGGVAAQVQLAPVIIISDN